MLAVYATVLTNTYRLKDKIAKIQPTEPPSSTLLVEYETKKQQAISRAKFYNELIERQFLKDGMVVNRSYRGDIIHECDSLLFSSLRYVALNKLEMAEKAKMAWESILLAQKDGKWQRHPTCSHRLSRDMILGVMAAFSQRPKNYKTLILDLLEYVEENRGYIGDGPFYVSYLSPGLAEIMRHFAGYIGISEPNLPFTVKYGFSTLELDTFLTPGGFQSHLIALVIWLEIELRKFNILVRPDVRNLMSGFDLMTGPVFKNLPINTRLAWHAHMIAESEPENVFFQYLAYKTSNALTISSRLELLTKLLSMPQFPEDRLPTSCERKADYLWQRRGVEYHPSATTKCKQYNGVDFLWAVALLTESPEIPYIAH